MGVKIRPGERMSGNPLGALLRGAPKKGQKGVKKGSKKIHAGGLDFGGRSPVFDRARENGSLFHRDLEHRTTWVCPVQGPLTQRGPKKQGQKGSK